jgi:hypothetical protein
VAPVFGKDHAPPTSWSGMTIRRNHSALAEIGSGAHVRRDDKGAYKIYLLHVRLFGGFASI